MWWETEEGIRKRNETYKRKFKEKYGVDNPQQLKEIKEKTKKTSKERYGGIGYTSSYAVKGIKTTIKKYGVNNIMKSEEGKELFKESLLKKHGVDNPLRNPEIAKKVSETKKGVPSKLKGKTYEEILGPERTAERIEELRISGAIGCSMTPRISGPQLKLYEEVKQQYPTAVLEYPVGGFCIDIAVPDLKLAFEYDGEYWHQDKEKDKKRDKVLNSLGWIVERRT
jgi:hypothetical protein